MLQSRPSTMMEFPRRYHKQDGASGDRIFSLQTLLVFLFIFFLPTQFGKHFFFPFSFLSGVRVDYLAPALYVTDLLAFALIITNFRRVAHFFRNLNVQVLLFILALLIFAARSSETALYNYIKFIEFLAVFAVFRYKAVSVNRVIFYGFFAGAVLQCILTVSQFILKHSVQGPFYYLGERAVNLSMAGIAKASLNGIELLRPYGTFSHPNSLGGFYLLLFAFYLSAEHIKVHSFFRIIFLALCSILVLLTFSKVALIALVVINVLYVIYKWDDYKDCLLCLFSRGAVLAVLCALFLPAQTDPLTLVKRIGLMENAFKIILAQPLSGVGMGNYVIAQHAFKNPYPYFFAQPVHNIIILTLSQIGIPATLYLTTILFRARKKIRYYYVLPYIVTAVLFTGMFDHYWITLHQNFFLIAVLFALI